jgi:ornithine cyclodeaminase
MSVVQISFEEGQANLDWLGLCRAFDQGHQLPRAEISDTFLYRGGDTLLNRSAWIDGLGLAVKCATVFPDNPKNNRPMINGGVSLFSDETGALAALVDFHLVTKWKTAGDSLCAALKLARPESKRILIVGAGTVGHSLRAAYGAGFPDAEFLIWNRTATTAEAFAAKYPNTRAVQDLPSAVAMADIITSATMSTIPVLSGDWFQPGQHIDLIGAYRPDMREVDDQALLRSSVFVDSYATTLDHIGELKIPLADGVITPEHVRADYYQPNDFKRGTDDEITLFKNGGGALLDLMTADYILQQWKAAQ